MKYQTYIAGMFLLGTITSAGASDQIPITRDPEPQDWDFVALVKGYQELIPSEIQDLLQRLSPSDLLKGAAWTYVQSIQPSISEPSAPFAVEISQILIPIPFETFSVSFPIHEWGQKLRQYIGGQVRVVEKNALGLPVRQVERMVLCAPLQNQDMTKAEQIEYAVGRSTVYWRVYHSDNGTTEADLGKLEMIAYDTGSTLLTFHSAHRLRMSGVLIPNWIVRPMLKETFLGHLRHYQHLGEF